MKRPALILILIILPIFLISADMNFRGIYSDYLFYSELSGEQEGTSLMFHSFSTDAGRTDFSWGDRSFTSPLVETKLGTLRIMDPETFFSYNSYRAYGHNDGALWQGKGFNNVTAFGMDWMNDWFSIRLYPEVWWAQNADYDIVSTSESSGWGDWWDGRGYDRLQRQGDDFLYDFNWGQSDLRLYWEDYLTFGFSNEEVVIGSGRENNILLSDNAGGFPHFDMGTYRPQEIWKLGTFETRFFWGFLEESDYYDDNPDNDTAWFSGMTIGYSPSFVPGLTLGATHQYYKPLQYWNALDLVAAVPVFSSNKPGADDDEDGMISLDFNWIFPKVGFTVYGEWANNDYSHPITSPEHTSAQVLGLSQILKTWNPGQKLTLSFEHANLAQTRTTKVRSAGPWYRHGFAGWTQGYSHDGQIPGAWIGPGSNSQWINFSYYHNKGMVGLEYTRICYDSDYFYNVIINDPDYNKSTFGQFIDNDISIDALYFLGNWNLYGKATLLYTNNENWAWQENLFHFHFETGLSYSF
ncbi:MULTISPECIES: hypothetical protein [unclassified Oceanispirochaeta]|uniref:hypothetical protein n=1 Tax=unclassified Oceanispirochaeta TaxID=2635722 RepID=UPI000E09CF82|nr:MULTISPECIES: hypothetical protein [unclassified Oceanispirochaeta]MBF9017763.1 hypothetical protein [Oceanispirochaeta sp. M2]NPD74327.1 hypothetical protein [Oceanispirochaeta sp. M1]RDG29807.1 hypothetical protein DV872_19690 [Oceanispirochaeta sp. M1]